VGAHIELYYVGVSGDNPFVWGGPLKVDIASPYFGTSNLLKSEDFGASALAYDVANCDPLAVASWYTCNFTAGFNAFNMGGTTQFRLYFTNPNNGDKRPDYVKLASGNYRTESYRPVLVVDYYVP
jgi:hypothetical protein